MFVSGNLSLFLSPRFPASQASEETHIPLSPIFFLMIVFPLPLSSLKQITYFSMPKYMHGPRLQSWRRKAAFRARTQWNKSSVTRVRYEQELAHETAHPLLYRRYSMDRVPDGKNGERGQIISIKKDLLCIEIPPVSPPSMDGVTGIITDAKKGQFCTPSPSFKVC